MRARIDHVELGEHIQSEVIRLSGRRDRFLEVGKLLRNFYEELPPSGTRNRLLRKVTGRAGVGLRTAMHWMEIDRVYGPLCIPSERLVAIGWAKLALMARHVNSETYLTWLMMAESMTLVGLRKLVKGDMRPTRTMVLNFASCDYALVAKVLSKYGANPSAGGVLLLNKEEAVVRICRWALGETQNTESER